MSDALTRAKEIYAVEAGRTVIQIRLALLDALIAEIERLQAHEKAHPRRAATAIAEITQRHGGLP